MIASSMDENLSLGEVQFDSLLSVEGRVETGFLVNGFKILNDLNKKHIKRAN